MATCYKKISKISYIMRIDNRFRKSITLSLGLIFLLNNKLFSTQLNPLQEVWITSITYSWDTVGSNQYVVQLSTNNFLSIISSNTLATTSTTYTDLKGNTSYYFRVKISTEPDTSFNTLSTVTLTASVNDLIVAQNYYIAKTSAGISLTFTDLNANDTLYEINYSTDSNFQTNITTIIYISGSPPFWIENLKTNTTYYFKIKPIDRLSRQTSFSNITSTQTVSKLPDEFGFDVFITSINFNWKPVNGSDEYASNGYVLEIYSENNVLLSKHTISDPNTGSFTIVDLSTNTSYYGKFAVLNSNYIENQQLFSFTTLSPQPQNFSLIYLSSTIATLQWDYIENPLSEGYILIASTSPIFDIKISSQTDDPYISTLSITNLLPNTSYFFKVGSINLAGDVNYSNIIETVTLSVPIDPSKISFQKYPTSIKATYEKLPDWQNPYGTKGYIFELSTSPFNGGVVYSSSTNTNEVNSLEISGLKPNTIYYARIATINRSDVLNYSKIIQIQTPIPQVNLNPKIVSYSSTTITISYSTGVVDGYTLEVSTKEEFSPIIASSSTQEASLSTLTITSLQPNTLYYIKIGALFSGATIYNYLKDPITTLSIPPTLTSFNVFITSFIASWNQVSNSDGYYLEASTSPNFDKKYLAYTKYPQQTSLTINDLTPNTSYYFRVGSLNSSGFANYTFIIQTSTLANFPIELSLTSHTTYSMQINYDPNSNPPDTLYLVEISSTNFSNGLIYSTRTYNNYAYFENLNPNTTYYKRITAFNRNNIPTGPKEFSAVATLAFKVTNLRYTISPTTLTLTWDDNLNSAGTPYLAEISSDDFMTIISSQTLAKSATFYNLNANTPYYVRVSALNFSNIPSEYEKTIATTSVNIPKIKTPPFLDVLLDGFTVQWDNNKNSTHTIYILEASTTSNFSEIFRSTETKQTTFVFGKLEPGTMYYIRLKAKGIKDNDESEYIELPPAQTLYTASKVIDYHIENRISNPYSYGSIEVIIPPYSFGSSTRLFVEPVKAKDLPPPTSNASNLRHTGYGIRIYMYPRVLITGYVIIKIPFSTLGPSINPNRLVIARYDDINDLWVPLKSKRYSNYVEGETYNFSTFAIMEFIPSNTIENVKIYPNPYRPNTVPGYINFSNLPPKTEIRIHTLSGELIKKLIVGEDGFVQWDGKNSEGRYVSSGVYLVVIKTSDGKKIIKKIGIER